MEKDVAFILDKLPFPPSNAVCLLLLLLLVDSMAAYHPVSVVVSSFFV